MISPKTEYNASRKLANSQTANPTQHGSDEASTKSSQSSWKSRFKQAACLALLAGPAASAASRPVAAGLPQPKATGGSRHLLSDPYNLCATNAVRGPLGTTITPGNTSSHSLAVMGNSQWVKLVCTKGNMADTLLNSTSLPLTYTFGPSIPSNASSALGTAAQNFAIMDLVRASQAAGIQTNRVQFDNSGSEVPNIAFGLSTKTGHNPWETAGLAPLLQITNDFQSHVYIIAYDQNNVDFAWRLSAVGQALGLKGRGQPGFGNVTNYDIGEFQNDTMSSVTFTDNAPCANVTRWGALDLRALVDVYGFAKGMAANAVITVDDNFGSGGIIASADLNNTLVASTTSNRAVQVVLTDDGQLDTFVGSSVARLAPGSVISHADINATNGGVIYGNAYTNTFIGSKQNDTFVFGAGQTTLTFNGGSDKAVFLYNNSVAYLNDFNENHTIWFSTTNTSKPAAKVQAWGTNGTQVSLTNGPTAYLSNVNSAKFNATKSVFGGAPQTTTASPSPSDFVFCANELQTVNVTVSTSQPGFDPCAHIGDTGFGGPAVAGCTGLG